MQADLVPAGQNAAKDGHTPVIQFFVNVQILANKEKEQAAILFGMLFTLVIWVFSALSLMMAVIFYITFLWHHIRDGSLSRYCRRKIDSRLHKIVMVRVNKALANDNKKRTRKEAEGVRAGTPQGDFKRQPTLPVLDSEQPPIVAPISRQTTQTDISSNNPRLPTRNTSNPIGALNREPTVPNVYSKPQRPQIPSRSTTQDSAQSNTSFADDAPLISSAAPLGYGLPGSRGPPSRMDTEGTMHSYKPPGRNFTGPPQGSQRSYGSSASQRGPPSRQNIDISERPMPPPGGLQPPMRNHMPQKRSFDPRMRTPGQPGGGRAPTQDYEMQSQPPRARLHDPPPGGRGYVAFNPNSHNSRPAAVPSAYAAPSSSLPPGRNFAQHQRLPPMNYFGTNQGPPQRSGTAPLPAAQYDEALVDAYGGSWQQLRSGPIPYRPATAGPGPGRHMPPHF